MTHILQIPIMRGEERTKRNLNQNIEAATASLSENIEERKTKRLEDNILLIYFFYYIK
jgi:hypothetical protein